MELKAETRRLQTEIDKINRALTEEEKNAVLINERMNFARQLENSLKDAQEKQEKIERLNMEMSVQRMKLNKKIWNLTKITCALVVALLLIIITAIILGLYLHYNF